MNNIIQQIQHNRKTRTRLVSIICVLAFCVAVVVFWRLHSTGVAMVNEATCGYQEHTHTEECYDAYGELTCGLEEHTHTLSCYSDDSADVETASIWEATLPELTGDAQEDMVALAESQLGYTESENNYVVADDGTVNGYTRYGDWYGNEYGDWNAMFAAFVLNYANVDMPVNSGAYAWTVDLGNDYQKGSIAVRGDLAFLDKDEDGVVDAVGIVKNLDVVDGKINAVTVIEGDYENTVAENTYDIAICVGAVSVESLEDQADAVEVADAESTVDGTEYTVSDNGVNVTVVAPDGALPEDAELVVELYDEDSEEYQVAAEAIDLDDESGMAVLDISFMVDGEEIEPTEAVTVSIDAAAIIPEEADPSSLEIQHLQENDGEIEAVVVADAKEGIDVDTAVAEFEVESFSHFTIHWHATQTENDEYNIHAIDATCYFEAEYGSGEYEVNEDLNPITGGELDLAYGNTLYFDDTDGVLAVSGYKLDCAIIALGSTDPDSDENWQSTETEFLATSLTATYNWGSEAWTVTFQYYPTAPDYESSTNLRSYTVTGTIAIHVHLYYEKLYVAGSGLLTIEDDIANTGSLNAVYTGSESEESNFAGDYYYKWYMQSGTDEDGNPIWEELSGEVTSSLSVYSFGARQTFMVELYRVSDNQLIDSSTNYMVPYYDQLQNGSFEDTPAGQITDGLYSSMVWRTTGYGSGGAVGQDIEIVDASQSGSNYGANTAADGYQYAELNAEAAGTLYQDVLTAPGTTLYWALSHRARNMSSTNNTDRMCVIIVDAEFADQYITTQNDIAAIITASRVSTSGTSGIQTDAVTFTYTTSDENSAEITVWVISSNANAWYDYSGSYTVPGGQYLTRFLFGAVSTSDDNDTTGNLLDNVYLSTTPVVTYNTGAITITKNIEGVASTETIPAGTYTFSVYDSTTDSLVNTISLPTVSAKTTETAYWTSAYITQTSNDYYIVESGINTTNGEISGYTYDSTSYLVTHSGTQTETDVSGEAIQTQGFMVYTNQITSVTYTNTYEPDNITLTKVDSTDLTSTLDGAVFTISGENGVISFIYEDDTYMVASENETDTVTQITLGSVSIAGLGSGTYALTEVTAPDGYNALTDPVEFTISGGSITVVSGSANTAYNDQLALQVTNTPGAELPNTGSIGTIPFYILGGAIVLGAAVVLFKRGNKTIRLNPRN